MAVRIESQAEPLPGYRLLERLGGGGFGEVWKCEAPGGLHKAIKFVFGDLGASGEDGQRAEQELKALSRVKSVRHPYILSLERFDICDGQLMIVTELADRNLWDRFKECRSRGLPGIPRQELLGYLAETAEALDLMNMEYQLQHLDIKPQNLFLVHNHVKVADFGLVKDLEGMRASMTAGATPVYAAPETFDGWVSRYCDQYSLAIVYQELLTGQRPFNGNNIRQLILQHMQQPPNVAPLPLADRPIIARALSKTPNDRFSSCRDLVAALMNAAATGEAPVSPSAIANSSNSPPQRREKDASQELAEIATPHLRTWKEEGKTRKNESRTLGAIDPDKGERQAPPEINGNGVLFPALVIGLGHLGMGIVQRLRQELDLRFGGMERLPHLRLLVLDTDPEAIRSAARGGEEARFNETDLLLTPLNRPSHYLKPRDGRPDVTSWLNARMLYRIPRSQVTTGVRALGRLVFCDNYRLITQRLQIELNACMDADALHSAVQQTGLGLRTNRVRVYVLAGLSGGTGSGMFLDLAYTVRAMLKQAGYLQPDVVGLFLLPNVDRSRSRTITLGNTCAAVRELCYFARSGNTFTAQYHQREPALQDSDPPFTRTFLLPLPDESDEPATRRTLEKAGLFLARDLCSPLGPAADLSRAGLTGVPWESRGLFYQTFGLTQLSWPRRELVSKLARRLCGRLVQRWMSKDSKKIEEAVRSWVEDQWAQQQLGPNVLMERLAEMSRQILGQDPEEIFRTICESLGGENTTTKQIVNAIEQYGQLLGKPQEDGLCETPPCLVAALCEAADKLVQEWGQKLAELPVRLIEMPEFRLAGAEEAVRQMTASIEQTLQNHEPLAHELAHRAAELYECLLQICAKQDSYHTAEPLRAKKPLLSLRTSKTVRKPLASTEAQLSLREYPKVLYQSLLLRHVGNILLTLRGHLADEMREINSCRLRLGELLHMLERTDEATPEQSAVMYLYPAGCKNLKESMAHFEAQLKEDALIELDARMEAMFKKQFTALVNVCLAGGNVLREVEEAMQRTAQEFVAEHLGEMDVAEMFTKQYTEDEQAMAAIARIFQEACPQLSSSIVPGSQEGQVAELCVLATPSGPAGERFRALAAKALPDVEWQTVPGERDIFLYREYANLPLSELPQVGPLAQDAYRQMNNVEHFTPHCRCDVDFSEGA